jgi:hypothetical protein
MIRANRGMSRNLSRCFHVVKICSAAAGNNNGNGDCDGRRN